MASVSPGTVVADGYERSLGILEIGLGSSARVDSALNHEHSLQPPRSCFLIDNIWGLADVQEAGPCSVLRVNLSLSLRAGEGNGCVANIQALLET